jgi:protein-disulfide isomerase
VERDIVLAKRMGISITPTFVINGEITERVSPAALRVRLSTLLKE